jgi:hypothetical protein
MFAWHQAPFRVVRMRKRTDTTIEFENTSCRQQLFFCGNPAFHRSMPYLTLFYHPATAGAGLTFTL